MESMQKYLILIFQLLWQKIAEGGGILLQMGKPYDSLSYPSLKSYQFGAVLCIALWIEQAFSVFN